LPESQQKDPITCPDIQPFRPIALGSEFSEQAFSGLYRYRYRYRSAE